MQQSLEVAARVLIGVVFLAAFAGKVRGHGAFGAFVASLGAMRLFPPTLVRPVAVTVAAGELLVSSLVAVPVLAAGVVGLLGGAALLGATSVAIATVRRRGVRVECRCFGGTSPGPELGVRHIVRNVLLAVAAIGGGAAAAGPAADVDPAALVLAGGCGLLLAGVVIKLDDIVGLLRSA
jgi:hypothetical protein